MKMLMAHDPEHFTVNGEAGYKNWDRPLKDAIKNGNLEAVKLLVERGAEVNARGSNYMKPMFNFACRQGN